MFAALIARFAALPLARIGAWVAAMLGLLALLFAISRCVDDGKSEAVQLNIAEASAEANARVLEADRATMANQMTRDAAIATERMEAQREADKVSTDEPVGPGVRSVIARMREQQEAARSR